jgi:anaerobic selenocysteine-containing dehydrogenase
MKNPDIQTVRGACPHDCPDTCAWQVTVEDGIATQLVGDSEHPFTRGGLCGKVSHYLERVYSSDRLLYPMRRVGKKGSGEFQRVSWEEALSDIGDRLSKIVQAYGATAILPYSYLGTLGLVHGQGMDRRFFARLGASRLQRDICGSTAAAGLRATQGTAIGILPEDLQYSQLILLWGTNTVVTNLHLWHFIRKAKANGAKIIVIDPLKTRTAIQADWHLRPLPGTDAALALGMMNVIVSENLHDAEYVAEHTLGFEQLCQRLDDYSPQRVATITGLEVGEIIELARTYAKTAPVAIRLLVGMEHHAKGAMMFRTIACLPALVGAWRDRGGGLIRSTGGYFEESLNIKGVEMPELEDPHIRTINMVQLGQALTDNLVSPIKALFVYNSNPAATAPDQNKVVAGLQREDLFTVVHEQFLTDTARYADYVLPATSEVEQLDLIPSWGHTYLTLNMPAISPMGEAIANAELFRRMAATMGFTEPYFQDSDEDMVRTALHSEHPYLQGITFERLVEEGWAPLNFPLDWRPFATGNFPTPSSGKCEFYTEHLIAQNIDPLPEFTAARESLMGDSNLATLYPLMLITAKSAANFLNSSYANLPRHLRMEREPLLEIHPTDAEQRSITEGEWVRVFNNRGNVKIRARVGDRVRPSVVSMPSGWWASLSSGGTSANALTASGLSDWGNGGDFYDTLVEVEQCDELGIDEKSHIKN